MCNKDTIKRIMNKKIPGKFWVFLLIFVVCGVLGYHLINEYVIYKNPKMYLHTSTRKNGDDIVQNFWLTTQCSRFGMPKEYHDREKEWYDKVVTYQTLLETDYVYPKQVYVSHEIRDGKTYLIYDGTVTTKEGQAAEIHKVIELSFEVSTFSN